MANEVAVVQESTKAIADMKKTAGEYLAAMGMSIAPKYREMFLNMASAYGLNPFKREIYCIPYGDKVSIVTSYDTYIKRAERTGKLDGWHVDTTGSAKDGTLQATITINRKDWTHPFTHTVLYTEVAGNAPLWHKSPVFMTKKVAIGQGFRLCFPDELGGMPYTADECDTEVRDITPPQTEPMQVQEVQPVANTNKIAPCPSTVIGAQMPQNTQQTAMQPQSDIDALRELREKYGTAYINPKSLETIDKALNGDGNVAYILQRTREYLNRKGVAA